MPSAASPLPALRATGSRASKKLAGAGATKLWVGLGGGDFDRQRHELRLLGEEIMPRFAA